LSGADAAGASADPKAKGLGAAEGRGYLGLTTVNGEAISFSQALVKRCLKCYC